MVEFNTTSSTMKPGFVQENVSTATKAKYDQLLQSLHTLLKESSKRQNKSLSAAEANRFSDKLTQLNQLASQGLEAGMKEDLDVLLFFLQRTDVYSYPDKRKFKDRLICALSR